MYYLNIFKLKKILILIISCYLIAGSGIVLAEESPASVNYELGISHLIMKDYRSAIHFFSRVVELDNDFSKAYAYRGIALYQLADRWGSIEAFEKIFPLGQEELTTLINRVEEGNFKGITEIPELNDIKVFLVAYREMVEDFNRALSFESGEIKDILSLFSNSNPLINKIHKAKTG